MPKRRTDNDVLGKLARVVSAVERRRGNLPAPQVKVIAPGIEFTWGEHDRRFHTASVGKTMTAVVVLRLAERGVLDLHAPVTTLLPAAELRGLFARGGVDRVAEVTVRHLLQHTSGVADYFTGRSSAPSTFAAGLVTDRDHLWSPQELLAYTSTYQRPVADPGRRFSYSDTGYVLLGRVAEEAAGSSFGALLHEHVFGPSDMTASCLMFHTLPGGAGGGPDTADRLELAPLWLGRTELSRARSLSCDWAGGGVVSTVHDLIRFSRAFSQGALLGHASLDMMREYPNRFRSGIRYGTGRMQLRYGGFSPLLGSMPRATGHLGVLATHMFAIPEHSIHLAMNFHGTREMTRSFMTHIRLVRALLHHAGE